MGDTRDELTAEVVDRVSLERALKDAEVANLRVIELTTQLLASDERVAELDAELAAIKRVMDPRRRMEHIFRSNHALLKVARTAKRVTGR